jgi:hypothetical protein
VPESDAARKAPVRPFEEATNEAAEGRCGEEAEVLRGGEIEALVVEDDPAASAFALPNTASGDASENAISTCFVAPLPGSASEECSGAVLMFELGWTKSDEEGESSAIEEADATTVYGVAELLSSLSSGRTVIASSSGILMVFFAAAAAAA